MEGPNIQDITERKRAEQALEQLHRQHQLILDSVAEGIHGVDLAGRIIFENPAAAAMLGWEASELIGRPAHATMHHSKTDETHYPVEDCPIFVTFRDGMPRQVRDEVFWRKDGTSFPVDYATMAMKNERNEIIGTVVVFRDITREKQAEAARQKHLERIHALREIDLAIGSSLELRAVITLLLDKIELFVPIAAVTTLRLYNPQTGELEPLACRGLDENEWKAQASRVPIRTSRRVAETKAPLTVRNLLASPLTLAPEIIRKRGLISYLGVPLIADDKVLGVLNLYTRQEHDFTEEEIEFFKMLGGQAAIAIENAQLYEAATRAKSGLETSNAYLNRALRQLSSLYTALTPLAPAESVEAITAGIVERLMEATGADAALIRLYDKKADAYLITGHRGFSPDYLEKVKVTPHGGAVEWVVEHGQPIIAPSIAAEPRLKGKVQLKQGLRSCAILPLKVHNEIRGIFHVASRKLGYFDEEQKHHLTAIARQMSIALENKDLFQSLRESRDALEKANKIKDDFLNVMSHELKTPLVVVIGYAELLQSQTVGPLNEQQKDALKRMLGCAGEQLTIINNILETLQLEAKTVTPEYQLLDVSDLLAALKSEHQIQVPQKHIKLVWKQPRRPVRIKTDPLKLKQILRNLITNAVKFTDRGEVTVSARKVKHGNLVEFRVSDTGIGIAQEIQDKIFDKLYQFDSSATRRYGGVGLGLYIVKQLTKFLGGEIQVESEPGGGSTFLVRIPNVP